MTKSLKTKFEPGRGYTRKDWDDVDNPEPTDEQLAQARPFKEALPELYASIQRVRGRPKLAHPKNAVTLRLDEETIAKFKSRGPDWRARMSEALKRAKV